MKIQPAQLDTLPRTTKLKIHFQRAGAGNRDSIDLTIAELIKIANAKADAADHEIADGALAAWEYYAADFMWTEIYNADEEDGE
jgi:hypothetical protein